MRKWKRFVAVTGLLALGPVLAACGSEDSGGSSATSGTASTAQSGATVADVRFVSPEQKVPECYAQPQPKDLTIGWVNPLGANEGLAALTKALQFETDKLGGKVVALDAQGQPDLQVSQIEQLIARKVDAIITVPLDPKALDPVLRRAKEANIPTIAIEATQDPADSGQFTSQMWSRRDEIGYLQAKAAAALLGPGGKYAQIGFAIPVPANESVIASQKKWGDEFGITSLGRADNASDDIAGGDKAMTELLSQYPDMQGVIGYNEESVVGAAAAARAQGKRDLVFVGANGGSVGIDAVRDGKINATVQMQMVDMGRCGVWGGYDAAEGKTMPPTVKIAAPKLITKENVDQVPTWDEQLQELYGKSS
jgi:ribose transport system substrate-binding protein